MSYNKIQNVYEALVPLSTKLNLRSSFEYCLEASGYPPVFSNYFVPPPNAGLAHVQTAVMLVLSADCNTALLATEDRRAFSDILIRAQAKWTELIKTNKASRVLTDYLE